MTRKPVPIRVPLLGISGKVNREVSEAVLPQGLKRVSELDISLSQSLPEYYYALELPNIVGVSVGSGETLGLFGHGAGTEALDDIFALGLAGQEPLICKVIKNDARSGSSGQEGAPQSISPSRAQNRRKSFMTPTPLHIPDSRVSPIPDSAHEMIYLKNLSEAEALKVVFLKEVVWMHPLVLVVKNPR